MKNKFVVVEMGADASAPQSLHAVYAGDIDDAYTVQQELRESTGTEWIIAEIVDQNSWMWGIFRWFADRMKQRYSS